MSYIVLARKWRPHSFDDLIGQEAMVKTFKNALSSEKLAHAYLFSGPRGVGKTSSARILAKALNCPDRKDGNPCNKCQSCEAITESASVDVFEIDGASNNSVDAIRELRETVKYAPSVGKFKIYIIDEVHMLSTSAFNALLKTLEEPPPHVVFIFATTEPKKIPATILSRCQHYAFRRISKSVIREQLQKIISAEKININEKALEMISRAADGGMRDALTLLDQACSFSDDITETELQTLLGLPEAEIISNLTKNILAGNVSEMLSTIKEMNDRGSDLRQVTKELVEQFRNLAIIKISDDAGELLDFSSDEIQRLGELSDRATIEELTLLLSELLKLEGEVRIAVNPRYTLELGLLRTSFVKGMTSIDELIKMLGPSAGEGDINRPTSKPPVSAPEKKTELTAAPASVNKENITDRREFWNKLIKKIDSDDHRLACKLAEAKLIDISETELSIGFNGGMSVLADFIRENAGHIQGVIKDLCGHSLVLKVSALPKEEAEKDNKLIKEEIISEPLVADALKMFEGSLVKVRSLEKERAETQGDKGTE